MKKKFYLVAVMILAALVIVSCSPENLQDGKTPETKKAMNSEEYKEYSSSIRGLTVAEAYVVVKADEAIATPLTRGLNGEYKYEFSKDVVFTTSEVRAELEKLLATCEDEKAIAFYSALLSSLPKENLSISLDSGSYINYIYDEATGIRTICSVDVEIKVNGKEFISIEKDRDDDWIEIEGIFFDNSLIKEMRDKAEDAAESIEEFFTNIKPSLEELEAIVKESVNEIKEGDFGKEAIVTGSYSFSFNEGVFKASFDYFYQEDSEDDKIHVKGSISFSFKSLEDAISNLFGVTTEEGFEKFIESVKDTMDVKISVNGTEVWKDAFIEELL